MRARHPERAVRFLPRYGVELQALPGGNVASLVKANELVSGAMASASFGLGNILTSQPSGSANGPPAAAPLGMRYDWFTIEAGVERTSFTLYNLGAAYADQFARRDFTGCAVTAHYNAQFGSHVPTIAGVSLGVRRANNAADLSSVRINERHVTMSPDGSTERTYNRVRKALSGDYEERRPVELNTDFVFYPLLVAPRAGEQMVPSGVRASIALDVFTRSTLGAGRSFVPGLGAYLTVAGAPLRVYGGVTAYRSVGGGAASDIVAGFPF